MTTESEVSRKSTPAYISVGSAYFLSVGVLYLWGYWSRFDINILEYLGLPDVIKLTAYPIASAFIFAIVGAVMGEFTVGEKTLLHGGGRNKLVGVFLNKHKSKVVGLYVFGTVSLYIFGPESKWQVLPLLAAIPIYVAAKDAGLFEELKLPVGTRSIVIYMLSILPFWAYGHGRLDASDISHGFKYKYLAESLPGLQIEDPTKEQNRYKYLGHAGGFIFLLSPDNKTVVIVNFEKIDALRLTSQTSS